PVGAVGGVLDVILARRVVGPVVDAGVVAVAVAVLSPADRAVLVFARARLVGALVLVVGNAVAIVVRVGAAVAVLEAVEVLRLVGALVDAVLDAVAGAVPAGGLEHDPPPRAHGRPGGILATKPP